MSCQDINITLPTLSSFSSPCREGFDGALNTGLTLRTIRVMDGIGEVRAGATLLHDR